MVGTENTYSRLNANRTRSRSGRDVIMLSSRRPYEHLSSVRIWHSGKVRCLFTRMAELLF